MLFFFSFVSAFLVQSRMKSVQTECRDACLMIDGFFIFCLAFTCFNDWGFLDPEEQVRHEETVKEEAHPFFEEV